MKIANINKAYLGNTIINGIGDYYRYFDTEVAPAYDNIVLGTCRAGTTGMVMQIDEVQYPVTIDGTNFSFHYTGSTLESLGGAFFGNTNLVSITYIGLDTRDNKRLNNMFQGNSYMTSVNFEGMPVIGIISLESMFYQASRIPSLDMSGWDTSKVTTTENTFGGCSALKTIDISGWDLSKVTNRNGMFANCNVKDIYMDGCNDATLLLIQNALSNKSACTIHRDRCVYTYSGSQWNSVCMYDIHGTVTQGTQSMSIKLNGVNRTATVSGNEFYYDKDFSGSLTSLNQAFYHSGISTLDRWELETDTVTDMSEMFEGCTGLTSADLSIFNTSGVTTMSEMFSGCSSLANIDISGWDMSSITSSTSMFSGCNGLTGITMNSTSQSALQLIQDQLVADGVASNVTIKRDGTRYNYVDGAWVSVALSNLISGTFTGGTVTFKVNGQVVTASTTGNSFSYYVEPGTLTSLAGFRSGNTFTNNITSIDFDVDFSRCTSVELALRENTRITGVTGIAKLDTSSLQTVRGFFNRCSGLQSVDVTGLVTSECTNLDGCFYSASTLSAITGLDTWDTSNVTIVGGLFGFNKCETLDISNWDLSKVTDQQYMFNSQYSLRHIYMNNTNQTTLQKIQSALQSYSLQSNVTIHRDGYKYNYVNGQWIESQDT